MHLHVLSSASSTARSGRQILRYIRASDRLLPLGFHDALCATPRPAAALRPPLVRLGACEIQITPPLPLATDCTLLQRIATVPSVAHPELPVERHRFSTAEPGHLIACRRASPTRESVEVITDEAIVSSIHLATRNGRYRVIVLVRFGGLTRPYEVRGRSP